jgi:hypothetical protein
MVCNSWKQGGDHVRGYALMLLNNHLNLGKVYNLWKQFGKVCGYMYLSLDKHMNSSKVYNSWDSTWEFIIT